MALKNLKITSYKMLSDMYEDEYFPNFLVDKIKSILIELCRKIEKESPQNNEALLLLTHSATEQINELENEFEENDSELETEAREIMAENFDFIVRSYGFTEIDIEDVIAPREW